MDKKMDKKQIKAYLEKLNKKLENNNQNADILICGGASMALLFDNTVLTKDIDGMVLSENIKMDISKYVEEIGREEDINAGWFNDAAKGYIDTNWEKEDVFTFSNLNIYSVKAKELLAMKLLAGRSEERDREDSIALMEYLDIKSSKEAIDILENAMPKQLLTAKSMFFAEDTFLEYQEKMSEEKKLFSAKEKIGYLRLPKKFVEKKFLETEERPYYKINLPKDTSLNGKTLDGFFLEANYVNDDLYNPALYAIPFIKEETLILYKENEKNINAKAENIILAVRDSHKNALKKDKEVDEKNNSLRKYIKKTLEENIAKVTETPVKKEKLISDLSQTNIADIYDARKFIRDFYYDAILYSKNEKGVDPVAKPLEFTEKMIKEKIKIILLESESFKGKEDITKKEIELLQKELFLRKPEREKTKKLKKEVDIER